MDGTELGKDIVKILVGTLVMYLVLGLIFPMTGRELSEGPQGYGELAMITTAGTVASYVIIRLVRKRKLT